MSHQYRATIYDTPYGFVPHLEEIEGDAEVFVVSDRPTPMQETRSEAAESLIDELDRTFVEGDVVVFEGMTYGAVDGVIAAVRAAFS